MNKSELVSKMTELAGVTKVQAEKGLSVLISYNRSSRERIRYKA